MMSTSVRGRAANFDTGAASLLISNICGCCLARGERSGSCRRSGAAGSGNCLTVFASVFASVLFDSMFGSSDDESGIKTDVRRTVDFLG